MARIAGIVAFVLLVALAATSAGEIVKITAERTKIYDGEKVKWAKIKGKRFMVYGAAKDWYLVEMTINKEKKHVWVPKADVAIDWGKTKTAQVVTVHNVNTLELFNGDWVQFCGILVPMEETPLKRQTEAWLKKLLEGKEVTVEYDRKVRQNKRGYDLAYVYVDGMFVNRTLVEYGLARMSYQYQKANGRYAQVFGHFVQEARKTGRGIWAEEEPPEKEKPPELEEASPADLAEPERQYVRHLSHAEKTQWAHNLQTDITVTGKRTKTDVSCETGCCDKTYIDEICWTKTLNITLKNGWGFALEGLTAQYDIFGKTGKTSASVILSESGEFADMDLKPGETRLFKGEPVEFKGTDSSKTGWQGRKYYGYRVTFYYKGTPVKTVAVPTWLADYGSAVTD